MKHLTTLILAIAMFIMPSAYADSSFAVSLGSSNYDIDIDGGGAADADMEDASSIGMHYFRQSDVVEYGVHYVQHGVFSVRQADSAGLTEQNVEIQTLALTAGYQAGHFIARTGPAVWIGKIGDNGGTARDSGGSWLLEGGVSIPLSDASIELVGSRYTGIDPLEGNRGITRYSALMRFDF